MLAKRGNTMRDLTGLIIGAMVGGMLSTVVYLMQDTKQRVEAANMVPMSQCLDALISTQPRFKP